MSKKKDDSEDAVKIVAVPISADDIDFGDKVVDRINGFIGIVTVKAEFINGCVQFCVAPKGDKKNQHPESWYIDWQRLAIIEKSAVKLPQPGVDDAVEGKRATPQTPGGPSGRGEAPPRY